MELFKHSVKPKQFHIFTHVLREEKGHCMKFINRKLVKT